MNKITKSFSHILALWILSRNCGIPLNSSANTWKVMSPCELHWSECVTRDDMMWLMKPGKAPQCQTSTRNFFLVYFSQACVLMVTVPWGEIGKELWKNRENQKWISKSKNKLCLFGDKTLTCRYWSVVWQWKPDSVSCLAVNSVSLDTLYCEWAQ